MITRRGIVLSAMIGSVAKPHSQMGARPQVSSLSISCQETNKLKVVFSSARHAFSIWSPECSMFWSSLTMKCRLKSNQREWRLWSERPFLNDREKAINLGIDSEYKMNLTVGDGSWPAVGRLMPADSKIGNLCDCWLEWDPVRPKDKELTVSPLKLASNIIQIKLVLRGIF